MSHKFLSHDYDVTILLQTALMLTAMFMKFIPSKKPYLNPYCCTRAQIWL